MTVAAAIKLRKARERLKIGMPGDNTRIVDVARSLRACVDAPVLGGVAVYLHGGGRATIDLDLYTDDRRVTADQLEAAGAKWDKSRHEHILDGVRIHTITPEDAKHTIHRTSIIDGVRVVSLKDLIAIKLISGLNNPGRNKDLGEVEELIRAIPLDKRFAGKLSAELIAPFKGLVDGVRANERGQDTHRF